MAKPDNHYEAAFGAWLRQLRVPFVAVDESRRSPRHSSDQSACRSLKNVDFIVSPANRNAEQAASWLVDVKGRQFPTAGHQYWRNWSTADELTSLANWETLFGSQFSGLLVFAYNVVGDQAPLPAEELFVHQGKLYGFVGIRLDHYASWAKQLSKRWGTVSVSIPRFRALARPVREIFGVPQESRRKGPGIEQEAAEGAEIK